MFVAKIFLLLGNDGYFPLFKFSQSQNLNNGKIPIVAEEKKNLGKEHYKAQNYELALIAYSDAIAACPDLPTYYGNRAACYMMLSDYQNALLDARYAVLLDPTFEKANVRIAKCCVAQGDIIGAEMAIQKVEELDRSQIDDVDAEKQACEKLRQLDQSLDVSMMTRNYSNALYHLDLALMVAPGSCKYRLLKAECLAFLGRCDDAVDIAVAIMKQDSNSAEAIYVRGMCFAYTDNLDKAIKHFELALQLDPDHSKAKEMRTKCRTLKDLKINGNALFRWCRYREAEYIYTEALKIDEFNVNINSKLLYNRALVYSKLNMLGEAIIGCTQALEMNPKYLKAWLLRARSHNYLGNYEECCNDYEAALQIQSSPEIKRLLRDVKQAMRKPKRKDYFKILGVARNASDGEIKKAYRKKALDHHPDRHANSSPEERKAQELQFKEISEAYAILSDQRKKMRYCYGQDNNNGENDPSAFDAYQKFRNAFSFGGVPPGQRSFGFQFQ